MKYISLTILLLLSIPLALFAKDEMVGAWLFDEGKGDIAEDSSGNKNEGTVNSAKYVPGKFGTALEFTGANSNVQIQHAPILSVETFTVMAWINVDKFTGGWQTIVTQNTDGPIRNYGLFINDGSGLVHYSFTSGKAWQSFNAKSNVVSGTWRHIAATHDKKVFRCYVDGEVDGETPNTLKPDNANTVITIGSWVGGGWIKGLIDEVALFNYGMTQNQIKQAMNGLKSGKALQPKDKLPTYWGHIKSL